MPRWTPLTLFRTVAVAEATTWALLLVGMFVKYVLDATDVLVSVFGMLHGVVFIAYVLVTVFVWVNQRWGVGVGLLALLSSIPPLVTLVFDRQAEKRGLLAGGWRLAAGGDDPVGGIERIQAWMLRRPAAAAGVGVVAVLALTAAALVVGPPASS